MLSSLIGYILQQTSCDNTSSVKYSLYHHPQLDTSYDKYIL